MCVGGGMILSYFQDILGGDSVLVNKNEWGGGGILSGGFCPDTGSSRKPRLLVSSRDGVLCGCLRFDDFYVSLMDNVGIYGGGTRALTSLKCK